MSTLRSWAVGTNPVSPSIVKVMGLVASMEPVSAAPVPMNVVLFATVVVVAQMNGWKPMMPLTSVPLASHGSNVTFPLTSAATVAAMLLPQ